MRERHLSAAAQFKDRPMESYYPVFLDLRGKRVLVVGGGQVALRKVKSLLECGAEVLVVAPEAVPELQQMARDGRIRLVSREYTEADLEGASLVISATDSRDVNQRVSAEAQARGVFVNVVDDPELCSFIVPSVMRRGELVVAVSTGGNSPLFAKKIRQTLEQVIGPEYGEMAALLGRLRPYVRMAGASEAERMKIWEKVLASRAMELLREGRIREAEEEARSCISSSLE